MAKPGSSKVDRSSPPATADGPLAAVLALLRPQTVLSKVVSGAGRWSVRKPAYEDPAFCLMLEGSCFLDVDGVGPFELREHDFLLLPRTPGFTLASEPNLSPRRVPLDPARESRYGTLTGPPTMRMLGGYFRFDRANAELVVRMLPPAVHVRQGAPEADRLRRLVESIAEEADGARPARDLVLERLAEVLLVEALRIHDAGATQGERGLLAGLADPDLARALREMHRDVARAWTLANLAEKARMSRAVFAERFHAKVGMAPMAYLVAWRMAVAKDLLLDDRLSIAEVARRVGYGSASAFSTAFTRSLGIAPSAYVRG